MTELRRTIDEIRFFIQNETFSVTEQFAQCAADYALQCREANARLRKCEEFLNQGLRSEALHLAEIAPNLLELTSQLDFPERGQWDDLLNGYAQPLPEPLLLDVAGVLNEAYALQEPLQRLLDQHRLEALARSPLPQRLNVLRSLAVQDSTSGHWESDIRDMELARFREIESEAGIAASKERADQLKALLAELNSSQWLETPPAKLVKELKQKGGNVVRSQAREQLELLEEALRAAHSSMDIGLARQLRAAWNENGKAAQLSNQDELAIRVAPVLEWIEDDDRRDAAERTYRHAVAELEQRIEDNALNSSELSRYGQAVEKCGRGIPEAVKLRYRNQLSNLQLGETRRNRMKIGGVIGGILSLAGIIGVAVYLASESQRSQAIIVAVEALIQETELEQASKLVEENSSRLPTAEGLALKKKLTAAEAAERTRVANFSAAVDSGGQLDDITASEAAIEKARKAARTADEKIVVSKLESAWKQHRQAQVAQAEKQFQTHVEAATASLRELDGLLNVPGTESNAAGLITSIGAELGALHSLDTKVAKELTSQVGLLESRFQSVKKAHGDAQRKKILLDKLCLSITAMAKVVDNESLAGEYRALVDQFVREFPSDPRVAGFKDIGNAEAVKSSAARSKIALEWKHFWPLDASDVENRIKSTSAFLTSYPGSPDRKVVDRYEAFLKSLQQRESGDEDSDEPVRNRIRTLFSGRLINDGHMLRTKDGRCYYLQKEMDYSERRNITLKYIAGFNDEVKSSKEIEVETLVSVKTEPPPQKVIADRVFETVTSVPLEAWDRYLQTIAQSLVTTKNVDDFLRYSLLLKTLQHAANGNALLGMELKKTLADLNDSQMDLSVSWMDPFDPAAKSSRQLAAVLLRRVTDLEGPWKRAVVAQDKLSQEVFRKTYPIGWIERSGNRSWMLRTLWTSEVKHALMCPSAAGEDGVRDWLPVGTVQGSKVELDIPMSAALLEGSIVFASPLSSDAKATTAR